MIDKFVGQYLLYVRKEVTANKLVDDLGKGSPKLGKFVNESKKVEVRINATILFKNKYNYLNKKQIIDDAIGKIKESPIPPESTEWKTFNSFENKVKYGLRCVGLNIEDNGSQLIYLYYRYKSKVKDIEYDVVRVILADYGNPEKFNSLQVDIDNVKMESKSNSNSTIQKDKHMSSTKYKRRYPYNDELGYHDRCDAEYIMKATPQEMEKTYSQKQEFLNILNMRSSNKNDIEDIIDALIEYRELNYDNHAKELKNNSIERFISCDLDDEYIKKYLNYGCELIHILKKCNLNRKDRDDVRYALERAEKLGKLIDIEIEARMIMEEDIQELRNFYSSEYLNAIFKYCYNKINRENLINAIIKARKEQNEIEILFEPKEENIRDLNELTREEIDEMRRYWNGHSNLEWDEKNQEWFDPDVENREWADEYGWGMLVKLGYLPGNYDSDGRFHAYDNIWKKLAQAGYLPEYHNRGGVHENESYDKE